MRADMRPNDYLDAYYDGVAGLDGNVFKNIGKAVSKAVKDTGHAAGKVLDNKVTKGLLATGLAVTGVGIPASAAIMGGVGVAGGALKKGGGLKEAVRRGYQGAATGAIASVAGKSVRTVIKATPKLIRRVTGTNAQEPMRDSGSVLDTLPTNVPAVGITPSSSSSESDDLVRAGAAAARIARQRSVLRRVADASGAVLDTLSTDTPRPSLTPSSSDAPLPVGVPGGEIEGAKEAGMLGGLGDMFKNPVVLAAGVALLFFTMKDNRGSGVAGYRRRRR